MKHNLGTMRTIPIHATAFVLFCTLAACSNAPESTEQLEKKVDSAMEDLRKGKEEAARELRELREKLTMESARAEERLKDPALSAADRTEWEASKKDISEQIDRLDAQLEDVDSATEETWKDVKVGTKKAADDVGNWFQRQAEKIDKKTKADNDKDGH